MTQYTDSLRGYSYPIHKRDGFICQYCGLNGRRSLEAWLNLSLDHLLPPKHPDREDPKYMVTACKFCNSADNLYFKHAKKRGIRFDGLSRNQLVKQRLEFVRKTREKYEEFWINSVKKKSTNNCT